MRGLWEKQAGSTPASYSFTMLPTGRRTDCRTAPVTWRTFGVSNVTAVSISADTTVAGIVYKAAASAFTVTASRFALAPLFGREPWAGKGTSSGSVTVSGSLFSWPQHQQRGHSCLEAASHCRPMPVTHIPSKRGAHRLGDSQWSDDRWGEDRLERQDARNVNARHRLDGNPQRITPARISNT